MRIEIRKALARTNLSKTRRSEIGRRRSRPIRPGISPHTRSGSLVETGPSRIDPALNTVRIDRHSPANLHTSRTSCRYRAALPPALSISSQGVALEALPPVRTEIDFRASFSVAEEKGLCTSRSSFRLADRLGVMPHARHDISVGQGRSRFAPLRTIKDLPQSFGAEGRFGLFCGIAVSCRHQFSASRVS